MFKKYHYLDKNLNNSAQCFVVLLEGKPIAFAAVIHFPHPNKKKKYKKIHRLVVLPDYQGIGVAKFILDFLGDFYTKNNTALSITSSSLPVYKALIKNPNWVLKRKGFVGVLGKTSKIVNRLKGNSSSRLTFSFEFVKKNI